MYVIKGEGIEFIKLGGYKSKHDSENEDKAFKKKKDEVDLANAEKVLKSYTLTRIFAWIGAIAGVCALIIKVLEILKVIPTK